MNELKSIKYFVVFLGVVTLVILLWYGAFFIPLLFNENSLANSGSFGDTFGVVTSLFSGLGFAGLVYTILLQLEVISNQRKQQRFSFLFTLVQNLKGDLENFTFASAAGMNAFNNFRKKLRENQHLFEQGFYNQQLVFCRNIAFQFTHLQKLLDSEKSVTQEELNVLNLQFKLMYFTYFDRVCLEFAKQDVPHKTYNLTKNELLILKSKMYGFENITEELYYDD